MNDTKKRRVLITECPDDICEKVLADICKRHNSRVLREINRSYRPYGRPGPRIECREFEIGEINERI